jgi:phosphoglucosamine mutase
VPAAGRGRHAPDAADAPEPTPITSSACSEGGRADGLDSRARLRNGATSALAAGRVRPPRARSSCAPPRRTVATSTTGGATHPDALAQPWSAAGSSSGSAFDGDGDRLIAVDHTGAIVDGDHIIAICALDLHARGGLPDDTVVVTVMTNLGFRLAMERAGIHVVETPWATATSSEALEAVATRWAASRAASVSSPTSPRRRRHPDRLVLADVVQRSGRPLAELAARPP